MSEDSVQKAIRRLQDSYIEYMGNLKAVLDFGEESIGPLVAALDHKHANPVAKALGLLMQSPAADQAFPMLFHWLITQSQLYPDVLEALVRAGRKPAPHAFVLIREYAVKDDDEAVQHLFELACRFPEYIQPEVVALARELLEDINPNMREIAADAIWRIGLPHGSRARAQL